jgi:hypothetical protein
VSEAAQPAQVARRPDPDGASGAAGSTPDVAALLTLEEVQQDRTVSGLISAADRVMEGLGFTEHGFRHANSVARENHGPTGALFAYDALKDRMRLEDLTPILAAIGNHEEEYGQAVSPISAAVILADKSDVHRSRVRKSGQPDFDIHDRVNYAAEQSFLRVDSGARTVTLELTIDTEISQVMEYFEIFLHRMVMCRRAAERLDCQFKITANGVTLL